MPLNVPCAEKHLSLSRKKGSGRDSHANTAARAQASIGQDVIMDRLNLQQIRVALHQLDESDTQKRQTVSHARKSKRDASQEAPVKA